MEKWIQNKLTTYYVNIDSATAEECPQLKKYSVANWSFMSDAIKHECGLEITDVDATGSKFFKTVFNNSPRIIRKR